MNNQTILILNRLSDVLNKHYGFVKAEGSNFGDPVINSGPCGPFANVFFQEWNKRFEQKVTISFIIEIATNDCYHIVIKFPNGKFYDGGVGIHDDSIYDERYRIENMEIYDFHLLNEKSYGLERVYPRFCPNFDITELRDFIAQHLDLLKSQIL